MRAGVPLMTFKEWKDYSPSRKTQILQDNVTLNWKLTPNV
jgi:hypothetical protein